MIKDIPGFEGRYAITKDGEIWRHPIIIHRMNRGRRQVIHYGGQWLASHTNKERNWYMSIRLGGRKGRGYKVHRLVALTYIPNPFNLAEVNHKNGNKMDNRVENLEWCTREQNLYHARTLGLTPKQLKGAKHPLAKLTQRQADDIREEYLTKKTPHRKLCLKYGVSFATIGDIIRKKRYQ